MLLTISQPPAPEFGFRSTSSAHDFAPRFTLPKPRVSPTPRADSPVSSLPASVHQPETSRMSTPHRGLPPPSAMALPEPTRTGVPPLSQSLGVMPAPPAQWHGQEDSMRNWLLAKAEEDKRKQEEEKTRQEQLRLEQRKVEQAMLRDSLQGGVPPSMIPIIYAGIGGANLASLSMELIQQYTGQLQAAQQQLQYHTSPDVPRESRMIAHNGPAMYAAPQLPQQALLPSQPVDQAQAAVHPQQTFSAYQPAPGRATAPTSAPRSAAHAQLPRLTTNEMSVQQPPAAAHMPGGAHALQQSQAAPQDQATSSPSIYFHHWVPPSDSKPSSRDNNPSTPASKGEPHHAHTGSHLSESDYRESPRKRKAQGAHQANPPPPSTTSPSFSTGSSASAGRKSGSQVRSRSIASTTRQDPDSRPGSSRRDADTRSLQASSSQQRHAAASSSSAASAVPRRRSDEERQPSRRRSISRQRGSSRRRSSADAARELLRSDRPAAG